MTGDQRDRLRDNVIDCASAVDAARGAVTAALDDLQAAMTHRDAAERDLLVATLVPPLQPEFDWRLAQDVVEAGRRALTRSRLEAHAEIAATADALLAAVEGVRNSHA